MLGMTPCVKGPLLNFGRNPSKFITLSKLSVMEYYLTTLETPHLALSERRLQLQKLVLLYDVPPDRRGRVWMILLGIGYVNSKRYVDLVRRGQSIDAEKIRKDVHRTFSNNVSFHKKVSLSSISRVLNALVHDLDIRYVQGMNVLLGPLLYVADEVFGFYMFRRLYSLARSYFSPDLCGVHAGCALLEDIMGVIDPELQQKLFKHNLRGFLWGFDVIMTFGACLQPLDEVLKLWDFLFSFGLGLMPLLSCLRIIKVRDMLLSHNNPYEIIRTRAITFDAKTDISMALQYLVLLPDQLKKRLCSHFGDTDVCKAINPSSLRPLNHACL